MEEAEPAAPSGDAAPPPDAVPSPAPAPPAKAPLVTSWEDRAALAMATLALLGSFLPWYQGQPLLRPTSEALVAGGLAALALVLFVWLRGPQNERLRRQLSLLLGAGILLDAAYVALVYYRFHAENFDRLGVVGHVFYLGVGLDLVLAASILLVWSGIPTRRDGPRAPTPAGPVEAHLRRSVRWGVPLLIFAVAFATYHADVERPSIIDFDEAHYVRVALNLTDGVLIDPAWAEPRPFNFEHPPVGKYLIAMGYALAGEPHDNLTWPEYSKLCGTDNPECRKDAASWRLGSVLAGSLGVVGIYWIGLRLFRSVASGVAAALLLLFDNLYYLHARTAMLDIFAAAFTLLAFGVFLGPSRGHRWMGAVTYGVAVGSKHYALFLLPPFLLLAFLLSRRTRPVERLAEALLFGLIIPFAAYIVTYAPYLWIWAQSGGLSNAYQQFLFMHQEGFRWTYRAEIDKPHPYISRPWSWIPLRRPVFYFVGYDARGNVGHIYAIGNPFIWWTGCIAVLYSVFSVVPRFFLSRPRYGLRAFWEWVQRPFSMHREAALLYGAVLFLAAYLPFFLLKRDPFNFYFLIAAPFFGLLLAGYLGHLWQRHPGTRLAALLFLLLAAAAFVVFHPVVAGTYITEQDFQYIMHLVPGMTQ
jgi:dolichyl-phosphate-mannose-protein mannosyltransferase